MRLAAHGIEVALPRGWDGRIYRRRDADPTLHAANSPLPTSDGDFGSGATAQMPPGGTLIVVKEYRPGTRLVPGTGLFAPSAVPLPLRADHFHPHVLQVTRRGQAGFQHFFTTAGRPFCLYAVIKRELRAPTASQVMSQIRALHAVLTSLTPHGRS